MLKVLSIIFRDIFSSLLGNIYSVYKLTKFNIGTGIRIGFPVYIKGKGILTIGKGSIIGRRSQFILAQYSKIIFSENVVIGSEVYFRCERGAVLEIADGAAISKSSRIFVQSNWYLGQNVYFGIGCDIFPRELKTSGKLSIGEGTTIGDFTIMDVSDDIVIGKNVAIGPRCVLYTHDHDYTTDKDIAWKGKLKLAGITIEDGAWIGSNVTILPGVTVGKHAVVAAGSVVTKNILPNSVYGGIPAKLIKMQ